MPEDKIDKVSNAQAAAWHGHEGIRANCIPPGNLHSAFTEHLKPEHGERRKQVVPLLAPKELLGMLRLQQSF